jgi:aldehyde dehydrogenase (NAD+)
VHRAIKDNLLKALRAEIAKAYGGGKTSPHLAKIVNEHHAARLAGLLDDAKAKGAQLISGGGVEGRAIEPTLIEAITPEMEIDQEEIFGPILPVMTYDDIEPVLARINARPKPLALYVFDRDKARVQHILDATSSGGVGVNLTVMQYSHADLPFGGVNNSGMGAAHGEHGFRAFSHERAVLRNRFSLLTLIFPPYEGRTRQLIDFAKRFLG